MNRKKLLVYIITNPGEKLVNPTKERIVSNKSQNITLNAQFDQVQISLSSWGQEKRIDFLSQDGERTHWNHGSCVQTDPQNRSID